MKMAKLVVATLLMCVVGFPIKKLIGEEKAAKMPPREKKALPPKMAAMAEIVSSVQNGRITVEKGNQLLGQLDDILASNIKIDQFLGLENNLVGMDHAMLGKKENFSEVVDIEEEGKVHVDDVEELDNFQNLGGGDKEVTSTDFKEMKAENDGSWAATSKTDKNLDRLKNMVNVLTTGGY